MPLSWNEIKSRALAFSKEWENKVREAAEVKSSNPYTGVRVPQANK